MQLQKSPARKAFISNMSSQTSREHRQYYRLYDSLFSMELSQAFAAAKGSSEMLFQNRERKNSSTSTEHQDPSVALPVYNWNKMIYIT